MSVSNVYQKLNAAITECEAGVIAAETERNRLRGMSQGFQLALRVLADEGVAPEISTPSEFRETIIPFVDKDAKPRENL